MQRNGAQFRRPYPDRAFSRPDRKGRVLIESSDPCVAWANEDTLLAAGYDVAVCWGPVPDGGTPCPLITGGRCLLAEDADVIVQSFAVGEREVFPMYGELDGCVLELPIDPQDLVAAVDRLHARSQIEGS